MVWKFQHSLLPCILIIHACGAEHTPTASKLNGVYIDGYQLPDTTQVVCWDVPSNDGNGKARELIAEIVTRQYSRAGLSFTGWGLCSSTPAQPKPLVIQVADAQPWGWFGCQQTDPWCVRLNLSFKNWPSDTDCKQQDWDVAWACNCKDTRYYNVCLKSFALHEFAHAIGLLHETNHIDYPDPEDLNEWWYRDFDAVDFGPYDPDSVVNYHRNKTEILNRLEPKLSDGDIATIRFLYPSDSTNEN